eukprot:gnl/TRDRNA2_/TRDRNA2_64594_c0_seq1.p1 gnl/TRDRNA2_/TRDRNA2_64594_c0~~gnl/TRDRNA2_/TRDRNA2_64594_c0_seq1.p1  ORF type:complete len:122 (-),score=5.93 gnl/TRDRNA2_/TRDRNA2_64594_c0_seq1:317-682(-)
MASQSLDVESLARITSFVPLHMLAGVRTASREMRLEVEACVATPEGLGNIFKHMVGLSKTTVVSPLFINNVDAETPVCDIRLIEQHFPQRTTRNGKHRVVPFQRLSGRLLASLLQCGQVDN